MGNARFSDDFKRDAVHQVTVRGYPVAEVAVKYRVMVVGWPIVLLRWTCALKQILRPKPCLLSRH